MSVPLQRVDGLELVLNTPRGRGVFATRKIEAGTIIDTAPVIVLDAVQYDKYIKHSTLLHYSYNWPKFCELSGKYKVHQAIVLGLGSMINHSSLRQNIGWRRDSEREVMVYTALRDLQVGEELLISYGSKLTFEDVEAVNGGGREEEEEEAITDIFARLESTADLFE